MRVKEWQGDVVFLHEVVAGAADRSYGIQVAKLAGLPASVIERARLVLAKLEAGGPRQAEGLRGPAAVRGALQAFAAIAGPGLRSGACRRRRVQPRRAGRGPAADGRPAAGRRSLRRSRRTRPSRHRRGRPDLRRTVPGGPAGRAASRCALAPRRARAQRPPAGRAAVRRQRLDGAATPGRCCASPTPPWSAGRGSRCSPSAPA